MHTVIKNSVRKIKLRDFVLPEGDLMNGELPILSVYSLCRVSTNERYSSCQTLAVVRGRRGGGGHDTFCILLLLAGST